MFKLIQLELRKFGLKGMIRGAAIADLVILGLMLLMVTDKSEASEIFGDYASMFSAVGTFTKATFTIYAAALIARFIIGEYNTKTITILFTYPVSRQRLLAAKLAVIVSFAFIAILSADLLIGGILCVVNSFYPFISDSLTNGAIVNFLLHSIVDAVVFSGVSLIPLYFGMRKKSVVATIITSILLTTVLSGNNNGFSLSSVIFIPILFAAAGVIIAWLTVTNIERRDVDC